MSVPSAHGQRGWKVNQSIMHLRYSLLAMLFLAAACSSQAEPQRVANPNRYIYVTGETVSDQCYRDLGKIEVTEPFARATVESGDSTMANRLRTQALKEYPSDTDAVIGVQANQNDAGTAVTVSGEAVEMLDHGTVTCALRDVPPVIDGMAQTAAGGMLGTLIGGLGGGTPQAAEGGGYMGAAAAGSYAAIKHQQAEQQEDQDAHDALVQQQATIASLQNERARLNECKEQEIPLTQCGSVQPASDQAATPDKSDEPDWNASRFDLQKQIQMQQDYITKLHGQIGDIKQEMQNQ
jgi:hypothetical protein